MKKDSKWKKQQFTTCEYGFQVGDVHAVSNQIQIQTLVLRENIFLIESISQSRKKDTSDFLELLGADDYLLRRGHG